MNFLMFPPAQILKKYISGYVFMELNNLLPFRKCSIPVGFPVMGICTVNTPVVQINGNAKQEVKNMICGITETPLILMNKGYFKAVLIIFQPLGITQLLGIPQIHFLNQFVPLDNLSLCKKYYLVEKIMEASGKQSITDILDDFFSKLLINQTYKYLEIEYAVNKIYNRNGNLKIDELLLNLNVSLRTFERRFKQEIGFTPKKFLCQVRLQKLLKFLSLNPNADIHDQIYRLGFYDQAHLIHNLKESLGTSSRKIEQEYLEYLKSFSIFL